MDLTYLDKTSMFKTRKADEIIDYQERARDFQIGDVVMFQGGALSEAGRVTGVRKGIGFLDVEFPRGNERVPVEDVIRLDKDMNLSPPWTNSAPVSSTILASQNVTASCHCADCGCKHKEEEEEEEAEFNVLANLVQKTGSWDFKRKKVFLDFIHSSPINSTLKKKAYGQAFSLWWENNPLDFRIFNGQKPSVNKTASSEHIARWADGFKPFKTSEWLRSKSSIIRTVSFEDGPIKLASYISKMPNKQYLWGIGSNPEYRVVGASFKECKSAADEFLINLGFELG